MGDTILIKNLDWLMKDPTSIITGCDVLIEGGRISRIEKVHAQEVATSITTRQDRFSSHFYLYDDRPASRESHVTEAVPLSSRGSCEIIDGRGLLAMPGLVNSHTHLCQVIIRGSRDDLGFEAWCEQVMLPLYATLRLCGDRGLLKDVAYLWSALSAIEALKGGVTCVFDDDIDEESVLSAWVTVGIRGVAGLGFVDQGLEDEFTHDEPRKKKDILALLEAWRGRSPLVNFAIVPSTPYLCSRDLLLWMRGVAEDYHIPIQTHLSETSAEAAQMFREFGEPPALYLDRLGLLGPEFSAVHCIHLLPEEIRLLGEKGCSVVYCPKSNMKLGNGVAPVDRFLEAGISVALGTDGPASNDLLDMFEEMRIGALLQKAQARDPGVISAHDLLAMATSGGSKVCGLDIGRIEEGLPADVVLVELSTPNLTPFNRPAEMLVHCAKACNVRTVIVDGKVVVRDSKLLTINEEEIIRQAALTFKCLGAI